MAQLDDLYTALKAADAAGDTEGAKKLAAYIQTVPKATPPTPETPKASGWDDFVAGIKGGTSAQLAMGAVRGAAGIGATIMQPFQALEDKLTGKGQRTLSSLIAPGQAPQSSNQDTRAGIDGGLAELGAKPSSTAFQAGKLGGEIAGTAGAGGLLAAPLRAIPAAVPLANALASGGMTTGTNVAPNLLARAGDMGIRMAGAAGSGAAQVGLVDPNSAGKGALIGAAVPGAVKAAGAVGGIAADAAQDAAKRLMQNALKPTIAQLKNGDAAVAVQTLLDNGLNPTEKGVAKLRDMISGLNDQVKTAISSSTATVDKSKVLNALADTRQRFSNQVSPTADLGAISNVEQDFLNHPAQPGQTIPVQAAQEMKQGTYKVLADKYGQLGSAETEAQKSLARGLKNEIADAVPGVGDLNAQESKLLTTLSVTERRALMDMNKNPMGLAALAHNPIGWAAFMADKSATFKALAARALNTASSSAPALNALAAPAVYRSLPRTVNNLAQNP